MNLIRPIEWKIFDYIVLFLIQNEPRFLYIYRIAFASTLWQSVPHENDNLSFSAIPILILDPILPATHTV